MRTFAAVFDLALVVVGAYLLATGAFQSARRGPLPGLLSRSLIRQKATEQFVADWTSDDWRRNGLRLAAIGAALMAAGLLLILF